MTKKSSPQTASEFSPVVPYIPASQTLPEVTIKGLILGTILAIVLAGSNAYLGLKMGQTISASIPAAVISMAVLRLFRNSNILENNIVQTIASAGEVVAAGIIFTIPALIVMGYWQGFGYWQVTSIAVVGGGLGILFSIPLRRALIVESDLRFPEGVATAEVLKAGDAQAHHTENKGGKYLVVGALMASTIHFCQNGLHILGESLHGWFKTGGAVFGFSTGFSLSMIGAGYIIGMKVGINLLVGAALAWLIGAPLYTFFSAGPQDFGLPVDASAMDFAMAVRAEKLRFIGVGTMVFGGVWTLFSLIKPIGKAISASFEAMRKSKTGQAVAVLRTDHDIPMTYVFAGILFLAAPIFIIFHNVFEVANLPITATLYWITIFFLTVVSLFVGFVCSSIGGYMAGVVGSSANPLSGVTIGAVLAVSLSLLLLLGTQINFGGHTQESTALAAAVIIIAGVVAVAAAISCDNLQDLKAGQLVGSTPWKQQLTLFIGVVAGAIVVAPILELLYEAYGIGGVFPHPGMNPAHALAAPQATLMASVAQGIFSHTLELSLVLIGVAIGIAVVIVDKGILARNNSKYRLSVLAVALGTYLPQDVVLPLVIGGLIHFFAQRRLASRKKALGDKYETVVANTGRQGLLLSAGLIAGDALIGIFLAIPFATYQDTNILAIVGPSFQETATILGTLVFAAVCYYLYILGTQDKMSER